MIRAGLGLFPALIENIKIHNAEDGKPFPCEFCEMRFSRKYVLNNHVKMFHESENETTIVMGSTCREEEGVEKNKTGYTCDDCQNQYASSEGLRRHKLIHTVSDGKPFPCVHCENKYTRIDSLNIHVRKCHGDQSTSLDESKERFLCDICNKTFSRKDVLNKHVKKFHLSLVEHLPLSSPLPLSNHLPLSELVEFMLEQQ